MAFSHQDTAKQPILAAKNVKSYQAVNIEPDDSHSDSSDSESLHESNEDIVAKRLNGAKRINVLLGLWTGVFLSALDTSIVAVVMSEIGSEFQRSNQVILIATAYLLSYTALQPLYGRISDIFGRKSAYLFAQAAFVIGSVLCGVAPNLEFLIVARIVAGIGGGGLNTMSSVITSDLVTLRERGVYQGYANTAFACGGTLGAPLGGWITERFGWRYCFYINLPICLIATYMTRPLQNYNLHVEGDGSYHIMEKLKKVDYAGAFSLVTAITCIILATSYGGNAVPWSHPLIIAAFVGFGSMLCIFILVESCWAKLPVLPMKLMVMRNPALCSLTNFFSMMASTAMVYFSPLFFVAVMGFSSSKAGFWVSARVVGVSLGSLSAGKYMSHYGRFKPYMVMTYFCLSIAMLGISTWTATTPAYIQIGAMLLDGFSAGGGLTASLVAMLSSVEPEDIATIASISYLFRSTGSVIGVSLVSTVFQSKLKQYLEQSITGPDAQRIIDLVRRETTAIHTLPDNIREIVIDCFQKAIKLGYSLTIVFAFTAFVISIFVHGTKLHNRVSK
ncbi:hypothetical protein NQZ79_g823 [Umbelopsis isabellina]|nr:hypothetical protein NQZ79_g823 [Umbelopsis isabellina]